MCLTDVSSVRNSGHARQARPSEENQLENWRAAPPYVCISVVGSSKNIFIVPRPSFPPPLNLLPPPPPFSPSFPPPTSHPPQSTLGQLCSLFSKVYSDIKIKSALKVSNNNKHMFYKTIYQIWTGSMEWISWWNQNSNVIFCRLLKLKDAREKGIKWIS